MIYTDWQRGTYQQAVAALAPGLKRLGVEGDHLTLAARDALLRTPGPVELIDTATHELGLSLIKPGMTCATICADLNRFLADEGLLDRRTFGYGHSFGPLSHYYGREAGLELRDDIDTVLKPGMAASMEPMLWVPQCTPGAGGYRAHDILILTETGAENITGLAYGPEANTVAC